VGPRRHLRGSRHELRYLKPTAFHRERATDASRRNLAVALPCEALVAVNDLVLARLNERGHGVIRPAHTAVFHYSDDTTTVSLLAERAQMIKQAMTELVTYLETHGYLTRTPDPADRRAKPVRPTRRGREVLAIAQSLVPGILTADCVSVLRDDLEMIRRSATDALRATPSLNR
jgi:DNA-binding MarR family transcriptional regulator